jgi:uncharacterized protein
VPLRVTNQSKGSILADRAEEATGFFQRFMGLMGKRALPMGQGLHIVPCNGIHTFFMRIPIDALFLAQDGTVVKLHHALPPWRATSIYSRARSVLELPAGTAAASNTAEGDRLLFENAK